MSSAALMEKGFRKAFKGEIVESMSFPSFDSSHVKSVALRMKGLDFDAVYVPLVEPLMLGLMRRNEKDRIKRQESFRNLFSADAGGN